MKVAAGRAAASVETDDDAARAPTHSAAARPTRREAVRAPLWGSKLRPSGIEGRESARQRAKASSKRRAPQPGGPGRRRNARSSGRRLRYSRVAARAGEPATSTIVRTDRFQRHPAQGDELGSCAVRARGRERVERPGDVPEGAAEAEGARPQPHRGGQPTVEPRTKLRARLQLMQWTGMRPSQMERLTPEDFKLDAEIRTWLWPRAKGKGSGRPAGGRRNRGGPRVRRQQSVRSMGHETGEQ